MMGDSAMESRVLVMICDGVGRHSLARSERGDERNGATGQGSTVTAAAALMRKEGSHPPSSQSELTIPSWPFPPSAALFLSELNYFLHSCDAILNLTKVFSFCPCSIFSSSLEFNEIVNVVSHPMSPPVFPFVFQIKQLWFVALSPIPRL